MLRNTPSSYGSVAKLLHWSIVVLIITQVVLGVSADDLPNGLVIVPQDEVSAYLHIVHPEQLAADEDKLERLKRERR